MFSKPLFISSTSATPAYTIAQSIRFNDDDSPVLTASQTGAGDTRKKNTFSVWVKRGNLTSLMYIGAYRYDATNYQYYSFDSSDRVEFTDVSGGSVIGKLVTTQVFRDPSAWYNLTFVWDSANAISSERMKIYVNGQRVTTLTTATYPSVNTDSGGASRASSTMRIGTYDATGNYLDGYLTDIVYIDNGALDPSSFGETNDNGIWIPKDVSGLTFGTRGFYIDGRDSSALGDDEAGSNDFTTSGLASNDQKPDTPTANQITFNPINNQRSGGTPSNGNLDYVGPSTRTLITLTANLPTSGKWCCAFKVQAVSTDAGWQIGVGYADDSDLGDAAGSNEDVSIIRMGPSSSEVFIWDAIAGAEIDPSLAITTSDEFWVAQDMDAGKTYLGIYDASATAMKWIANDGGVDGNPSAGTNETKTNSALAGSDNVAITVASKASNTVYLQKSGDVSGTVPTGYTYFENVMDLIGS